MKKIERAVIMSDLHLGVESSLFFHEDKQRFKKVMDWLVLQLKELGKIDELVLLGDFLDIMHSNYSFQFVAIKYRKTTMLISIEVVVDSIFYG